MAPSRVISEITCRDKGVLVSCIRKNANLVRDGKTVAGIPNLRMRRAEECSGGWQPHRRYRLKDAGRPIAEKTVEVVRNDKGGT